MNQSVQTLLVIKSYVLSNEKSKNKIPKQKIRKVKIKNDSFFRIPRVADDSFIGYSLSQKIILFLCFWEIKMKTETELELTENELEKFLKVWFITMTSLIQWKEMGLFWVLHFLFYFLQSNSYMYTVEEVNWQTGLISASKASAEPCK